MRYAVLIGDLVASRELENRDGVQRSLQAILDELNESPTRPLSPYTLTLGDEFQAVYGDVSRVFCDLVRIMVAVHPARVRFAIGVGRIATAINRERALGMDGTAFHAAREGISALKQNGELFALRGEGIEGPVWDLARSTLTLFGAEWISWRYTRMQILALLYEGWDVEAISQRVGITARSVYKNVDAASLPVRLAALGAIAALLQELLEESAR